MCQVVIKAFQNEDKPSTNDFFDEHGDLCGAGYPTGFNVRVEDAKIGAYPFIAALGYKG